MYLPISTTTPIFVGGVVRYVVDRVRGSASEAEAEFSPGVLLSSGYIAGGAIAGVLTALLAFPANGAWLRAINLPALTHGTAIGRFLGAVGESESPHPLWSNLWGLAFFGALTGYLLYAAVRGQGGVHGKPEPKA